MKALGDLDNLTRKTRRREFEDGLVDLLNAAVFLVCCVLIASIYSPASIRWYIYLNATYPELTVGGLLALVPLLALFLIISRRRIEQFRREKLWRESGFVRPLSKMDWRVSIPAALIVSLLSAIGLWGTLRGWLAPNSDLRFLIGGLGIAAGVVYFGKGLVLKFPRYIAIGIVGGSLSITIILASLSLSASWVLLGIIWSVTLLLSGFVGLRSSLRAISEPSDV